MSGIFIRIGDDGFDNTSAFKYFVENSICTIISVHSNIGFVIKLTLNLEIPDIKYPYGTLKFDPQTREIGIENVTNIVLKFVIVNKYHNYMHLGGERHDFYEDLCDIHGGASSTCRQYENGFQEVGKKDFMQEVKTQKIVFFDSYVVDYQLKAICPDIIGITTFSPNIAMAFKAAFTIPNDIDKEIINKYFSYVTGLQERKYDIGCIMMEYIEGQTLSNFILNERGDLATPISQYLMLMKAKLLILVDKLHYVGFQHYDLHTQNIIVNNPESMDKMEVFIIDYDKARLIDKPRVYSNRMITGGYHKDKREIPFDSLDSSEEKDAFNKKYVIRSIMYLEQDHAGENHLVFYNNSEEEDPGNPTFIPIDVMNKEYRKDIDRGNKIKDKLLSSVLGPRYTPGEENDLMKDFIDMEREHPYTFENYAKSTGAHALLQLYLETNNYAETCLELLTVGVNCIKISGIIPVLAGEDAEDEDDEAAAPEAQREHEEIEGNYRTIRDWYARPETLPEERGGGGGARTKKYKNRRKTRNRKYKKRRFKKRRTKGNKRKSIKRRTKRR